MYLIFRDTLNHTLLYLIDVLSEHDALHTFVMREMSNVLFNPSNQKYMVSDALYGVSDTWYDDLKDLIQEEFISRDIRFEVCAVPDLEGKEFLDFFCSKDQIYQIPDDQVDRYLANKHQQTGLIYLSLGRYREAVQEFRSATTNTPRDYIILAHLADTLVKCDELAEAIIIYKQFLTVCPTTNKIDCFRKIGQIYRSLGDHTNAVLHFVQYLDLVDAEDEKFRQYDIDGTPEPPNQEDEQELQDRNDIKQYVSTSSRS